MALALSLPEEALAKSGGFDEWVRQLDEHVQSYLGVGLEVLPELPLEEIFAAGYAPAEVFAGVMFELAQGFNDPAES